MAASRLSYALEKGLLALPPEGRIALFNPPEDVDLAGLSPARFIGFQPMKPLHDALVARGIETSPEAPAGGGGGFAAALVFLPRARAWARALVAQAAAQAPLVIVDGARTDGVEPLIRALKARVMLAGVVSKAHGKLIWFESTDLSDWAERETRLEGGWITRPGIFSADGPDPGSQALAAALAAAPEPALAGRVADLGAGWGFLGRTLLARPGLASLDLIEADARALACARVNLSDPRARFIWADALSFRPDASYDAIVTNPPFHLGRRAEPGLGQDFIAAARAMLAPAGTLWLVANRHLPYEAALAAAFAETEEIAATPGFKVLRGTRPRRQRRR